MCIRDRYETMHKQIEAKTLDPSHLVDTMQTASQQLKDDIVANKAEIENLNEAQEMINKQQAELKKHILGCEAARVDVVFRVFSLKAMIQNRNKTIAHMAQ
eukprot:TRINITY_DN5933_c0_g1_i3.p1 TRINITY_DN5933_c0_g1~~TRINITY_DN5933_c0_g1_i3.p1  ORF type:complete len:101 (-),score=43.71 TRINITY_DN5933_c0_g1_i3:144-446(-)